MSLGMEAVEVVEAIVRRNPEIARIWLVRYVQRESPRDLSEALARGDWANAAVSIERASATAAWLRAEMRRLEGETLLGFLSEVVLTSGERAHVPLMDFDVAPTPAEVGRLKETLRLLGQGEGFILGADERSCHYYGIRLLSADGFRRLLGACLLTGLVNPRYVGHQLINGACTLRLSSGPRRPQVPVVVDQL